MRQLTHQQTEFTSIDKVVSKNSFFTVAVVGAGSAGLNAALVLGRARRSTLLLDSGPPRNAPAHASHGLLTRDGTPPLELLRIAHEQLAPYPVTRLSDYAENVTPDEGGFTLLLKSGQTIRTRRLLLATGVTDLLPDIPGLQDGWARPSTTVPTATAGKFVIGIWPI